MQAGGTQQPGDPLAAVAVAVTAQLGVDPRGAVAPLDPWWAWPMCSVSSVSTSCRVEGLSAPLA